MRKQERPRTVLRYRTSRGDEPFTQWIASLRDVPTRQRILRRIDRLEFGSYGDFKSLKHGVLELRFHFGSGYRVYFGEDEDNIVLLLIGGDKSSQKNNIEQAKVYWEDYKNND